MAGHVEKHGDRWKVVVELAPGPKGKRRRCVRWLKGTKKQAEALKARLEHERNTNVLVETNRLTVAQYLHQWLETKTGVATKTREQYLEFIDKHFIPAFGSTLLVKLSPMQIQRYYSQRLKDGRTDGRGGLSPRSVLHHHRVLRQALKQAVNWQLIVRNPTDGVQPPRVEDKEMAVLTLLQAAQLVQAAAGTRLEMPIMIAIATGVRRGEVLGLRWQDLDLQRGVLHVRQTLQRVKGGAEFKPPKTQKSRRTVTLPAFLVDGLTRHRAAQQSMRETFGSLYHDQDLVICQVDGQPWSPNAFTHAFTDLMAQTELPRVRFHDLRHSHLSQLLEQGVPIKVVSERAGHSNVNITLNTYAHVMPGMQEAAAVTIDTAFQSALGQVRQAS